MLLFVIQFALTFALIIRCSFGQPDPLNVSASPLFLRTSRHHGIILKQNWWHSRVYFTAETHNAGPSSSSFRPQPVGLMQLIGVVWQEAVREKEDEKAKNRPFTYFRTKTIQLLRHTFPSTLSFTVHVRALRRAMLQDIKFYID